LWVMYSQHGNRVPSVFMTEDLKGALQNLSG
jgi:hypothetical protein